MLVGAFRTNVALLRTTAAVMKSDTMRLIGTLIDPSAD
jgi:hypothetical protein